MDKKMYELKKKMKIIGIILFVIFIAYFALIFFTESKLEYYLKYLFFFVFGVLIIGEIVYVIQYIQKTSEEYRNNLVSSKPKQRFRYLDTFYYLKAIYTNRDETISNNGYFAYNIIEDINSKKIYAISIQNANVRFQKVLDNIKLLRIDNIEKINPRKDFHEINFNDEGSLWIDQELTNCYQNNGDTITIKYSREKHEVKINDELFNMNKNYNISLLNKATFITGYAEFDKNN